MCSPDFRAYNIEKVSHELRSVVGQKVVRNAVGKYPIGQNAFATFVATVEGRAILRDSLEYLSAMIKMDVFPEEDC